MNVLKHSSVYVQIYICRLFSIRNECFTDNYSHPKYENGEKLMILKDCASLGNGLDKKIKRGLDA